jgi:hypothetical protein
MRLGHAWLGILLLLGGPSTTVFCAEPARGSRVRVTSTTGKRLVGTLARLDGQTLSLMAGREGGKEIRLPRVEVAKLEVSQRQGTRGKWIGIGLLAGVAVGTAIGVATEQDCGPKPRGPADLGNLTSTLCHDFKGMNTTAGAVLGAAAGSLLGLAISHGERWEVASLDKVRLTAGWSRRGVGLHLSFGF